MVLPGNVSGFAVSARAPAEEAIGAAHGGPATAVLAAPLAPVNTSLTVGTKSVNLSSDFWGATVNNEVRMFPGESTAVNATPARVLVWPGAMAGEDYDPLANIHYDTYSGQPKTALTSESEFVQMCKATHCTAIVQVPAEIDNASFAEAVVNYTEVNLSFVPAFWMIGNEPELWGHWKVPWKDWPTTSTNGPTPTQFGREVLAYVKAIRAVDNSTPILGLPASGCTCGSWTFPQWISGVLNVTGPKIQAVAFHEYPAGWLGTGNGSLEAFYGTIQSAANIPTRLVAARAAVVSSCPTCNVSVFISEVGSALSWSSYGQYAIGFSGSLSLSSQVTQAMDDNLTNLDLFATELATTNSWFSAQGLARVDYTLYSAVLNHLGTQAFPVNVTGLGHTLYGIDTIAPSDQGRRDLLVVNDNITKSIQFSPQFAESTGPLRVESWSWNGSIHHTSANGTDWVEPYTASPVPQAYPDGLPTTYVLPPQSLVLFEAYPTGGTYVQVSESGVPAGAPWYASVGSEFYTTTASNLTLLLHTGAYPVGSVPIPLPVAGRERVPEEQLVATVASPFEVSGSYANLTLPFHIQWRVNVTPSLAAAGNVTPAVTWWNNNQSLTLTETPATGYAFVGWSGWGPGSANGNSRSITLYPTGRVTEKARFVVGDTIELYEFGLPTGTPWSVTVRNLTTASNATTLNVYEPYGTYGFTVHPVPGYRALPKNGGFTVNSSWRAVEVQFVRITPPPLVYRVLFQVSGLPSSTSLPITVRGATQTTLANGAQFELANGSYAYHVGYVPGYHLDAPLKTFHVQGGAILVDLSFVRTVYTVHWEAAGTHAGLNWSVVFNGTPMAASSAWVSTSVPNGTYSYSLTLPANFSATPRSGVFVVDGNATSLSIVFGLVEFATWFELLGSAPAGAWSIRLGNLTHTAAAGGSTFMAANGSYTFDVHPPAGYYAVPSHGTLTVAGPSSPIQIRFHLSSEQPSAALVAALSAGALWTSLWIGVSVFVGFAIVRGLRRRGG